VARPTETGCASDDGERYVTSVVQFSVGRRRARTCVEKEEAGGTGDAEDEEEWRRPPALEEKPAWESGRTAAEARPKW